MNTRSSALSLDWERICTSFNIGHTKRTSGVLVILCPFHKEKTPSLHMWPKSRTFKCHGCGKSGHQKSFIADMLGVVESDPLLNDLGLYALPVDSRQMFLSL